MPHPAGAVSGPADPFAGLDAAADEDIGEATGPRLRGPRVIQPDDTTNWPVISITLAGTSLAGWLLTTIFGVIGFILDGFLFVILAALVMLVSLGLSIATIRTASIVLRESPRNGMGTASRIMGWIGVCWLALLATCCIGEVILEAWQLQQREYWEQRYGR